MVKPAIQGVLGFPADFYDKLIYDKSVFLSGADKLLPGEFTDFELVKSGITVGDQGRYGVPFKSKFEGTALKDIELSATIDWMDYGYIIPDASKLRTRIKNRPKLTQFQIQSGSEFFGACKDYNILAALKAYIDSTGYQVATEGGYTWDEELAKPDLDIINGFQKLVSTAISLADVPNVKIFYPAKLFGVFLRRNMFENIVTNLKKYLKGTFELSDQAFVPYRPPKRPDGTTMTTNDGTSMDVLSTSAFIVAPGAMLGEHYEFNPAAARAAKVPLSETAREFNFGDKFVQWRGLATLVYPDIRISSPVATSPSHRIYEITGVST